MIPLLLIALYLTSAVLAYGMSFAYWQRHFPTIAKTKQKQDRTISLFFALFGPIALFVVYFLREKKTGLQFRS